MTGMTKEEWLEAFVDMREMLNAKEVPPVNYVYIPSDLRLPPMTDMRKRLDDLTEGVEGIPMKDLPQETQDAIKATVDNLLRGRPGVEIRIKQGQGTALVGLRDTLIIDDDEDKK